MPSAIAAPVAQLSAPPATEAGGAPAARPADTRTQDGQTAAAQPQGDIVPEAEFDSSLPPLSGDINAPLEAMPSATPSAQPNVPAATPAANAPQTGATAGEAIPDAPLAEEAELAQPLPPIATFDANPVEVAGVDDKEGAEIRYKVAVNGLDDIDTLDRFDALSSLKKDGTKAANAAMITARAKEDEQLAVRILHAEGYYDGTAVSTVEQQEGGTVQVTINVTPGPQYKLASIKVDAAPTTPPNLVDKELPLKVGEPIIAERVQAAEANVSLKLPQQGYPFVKVGERDILLDEQTVTGDYTLPVDTGPRSSFGGYTTDGKLAFDAEHVGVLARFEPGELYDTRKVDDLRDALVGTGLFSSVSVEPKRTGQLAPDGTEYVDLAVHQTAGPARTLAAEAGYGTGQGVRVEGSWTHRNLFPPEGALIIAGVAGTQEQGLSATFRRQNAGKRDRTVSLTAAANHSNYEAYEAFTGTLAGKISYDSTPIWQKRFTYSYGFETNKRDRGTYFVAALPLFGGFDTSDNLLNPTKGFRLKLNASPETSVRGDVRPYGRFMVEGTAYYPVTSSIVLAGRARAGSIFGIDRDDLAPSRRYYAGGGGSVRGFGYQELGPRAPDGDPIGGRSLNEFAIEARYRFGNFGIVPFLDAGQVYEGTMPDASDLRFGAGIGGRFYTNFGPLRVDVATPLKRREGESKVALYISIGQAF
ncbi:autotransporter assembly complex protein TamA [Sphingomonas molluscorum]|uniref:autotransporter assembly complex protein TamA n=1 Tax=Sphingomonas molluscorum TaxID=418184 RepID=UPI0031DEDC9E